MRPRPHFVERRGTRIRPADVRCPAAEVSTSAVTRGNSCVRVVRQMRNEPGGGTAAQPACGHGQVDRADEQLARSRGGHRRAGIVADHPLTQAEIGALRVQADAMTVAVTELQGAAAANRLLWDGPAERGRTFLLTVLAFAGGAACARIAGGTDAQSGLVGFGRAAELLSRERVASKQTAAAVREPLTRALTAAAPLMRCSGPAVVTATEQLLNALSDVENTARLEAALKTFGQAVNAATAPQQPWWARRRGGRAG